MASAPAALDTLNELAAAIGNDANYAATVTTALAARLRVDAAQSLTEPQAAQGRANLGVSGKGSVRNRHLNPAFQVCQDRATGATVVMTSGGYVMDGVTVSVVGGGALTCSQALKRSPGGSPYRARFTVSTADASIAAGEYALVEMPIEGVDVADLQFGTAAARAFVWRGVITAPAGVYHLAFRNAAFTRSYVVPVVVAAGEANTDKLVTVTVPGDTTGTWISDASGAGIWVSLTLAAGSTFHAPAANAWLAGNYIATSAQSNGMSSTSNVFEVADIGLYAGTELPAWEMPAYAEDFRKCQRYYETGQHKFWGYAGAGWAIGATAAYKVTKRVSSPAIALSDAFISNCTVFGPEPTSDLVGFPVVVMATGAAYYAVTWAANARF